jgi:hypothetical protein
MRFASLDPGFSASVIHYVRTSDQKAMAKPPETPLESYWDRPSWPSYST